jgi:hypothetical protein
VSGKAKGGQDVPNADNDRASHDCIERCEPAEPDGRYDRPNLNAPARAFGDLEDGLGSLPLGEEGRVYDTCGDAKHWSADVSPF